MRLATALTLAVIASPVAAESAKQTTLAAKVGKSNVQIRLILHPQAAACSAALNKEIRARSLSLGVGHVRENLSKLVKQAGTDASGDKEFFGVDFLVGCPKDGTAWIAFPAEGKDKSVTRYAPQVGWSPMVKI